MAPFKIGDYIRRLEEDYCVGKLKIGGVYSVSACYDVGDKGIRNDYRVKLSGLGDAICWDAFRFELVQPHYIQACPHGIHWFECLIHEDGNK